MESLLMKMTMETDVEAFKILTPSLLCVVVMVEIFAAAAMEAAEGQGFVMAAME
jgi:hypothetical protein